MRVWRVLWSIFRWFGAAGGIKQAVLDPNRAVAIDLIAGLATEFIAVLVCWVS